MFSKLFRSCKGESISSSDQLKQVFLLLALLMSTVEFDFFPFSYLFASIFVEFVVGLSRFQSKSIKFLGCNQLE